MAMTDLALCVVNDREFHPALVQSCRFDTDEAFIAQVRAVVKRVARRRMFQFGTPYTDDDLATATNQVWADIHRHVKEL